MTLIVATSLISLTFVFTFALLTPSLSADAKPVLICLIVAWILAHIFFQLGAYWQRDDSKFRQSLPPPTSQNR
jgi:predicted Na+-dependent transporter